MSALPDLSAHFVAMERLMEAQPEDVRAEIARGVYAMSPRPWGRHGLVQARLTAVLDAVLGPSEGSAAPEWLFLVEPEIRSPETFSRLVPDLAAWRRSTTGWPDLDATPIMLAPDWVAEILSPGTESFDRGPKKDAYGLMGAGWLWLVDPVQRTVQTFANVRGKMVTGPSFAEGETISAPPFGELSILPTRLFPQV
jgi:Uma2 family endonuclease